MIHTKQPPSPKGPPPKPKREPRHWSQQIQETVASAIHEESLSITLKGGADNGQFVYLGNIDPDKISYHGEKLFVDDILLEVQGQKVSGNTLLDATMWLKKVSQNGAPVMIKTVRPGALTKDLRQYLATRFPKGCVDHDLQQTIRDNLYVRTVPCTTRAPRPGEVNGVDYNFLTLEEFAVLEKSGELLESGIFDGNHYGTPRPPKEPTNTLVRRSNSSAMGFPGGQVRLQPLRKRTQSGSEMPADLDDEYVTPFTRKKSLERAHSATNLGPLLPNWEMAFTEDGHPYFIDHNTETTHWLDPRLAHLQKIAADECEEDELPFGWEKVEDPHYGTYFIDHVNRRTQYENPVSAAKKDEETMNGFGSQSRVFNSKPAADISGKRSASDNSVNINGGVTKTEPRKPFFTKHPGELQGELVKTTLVKSPRGFGFTIIGGDHADEEFLQIKNVVPNGPAYLNGKLKTGDVIVFVSSTCVLGYTHQDVVSLFQTIPPGDTVTLEICRGYPLPFDPDDPNTEIVTTLAVTLPQEGAASTTTTTTNSTASLLGGGELNASNRSLKSLPDLARSANMGAANRSFSQHSVAGGLQQQQQHGNGPPDLVNVSGGGGGPGGGVSKAEVLSINIVRGPMGFGFTIADSPYGQKVKQILDKPRCKTLQESDLLQEINSVDVRHMTHAQIVQVLKECPIGTETRIVVQRGGLPHHSKKKMKTSQSFDDRTQIHNNFNQPGAYFFTGSDSNIRNADTSLPDDEPDSGRPPGKDPYSRPKTPSSSSTEQRPKTPSQSRPKTPTSQPGPRLGPYPGASSPPPQDGFHHIHNHHPMPHAIDGGYGPREGAGLNHVDSLYDRTRPPAGSRVDPLRGGGADPLRGARADYRDGYGRGGGEDRYGYAREVKPGQFRSRTPGPELMARGGMGPDFARSQQDAGNHHPNHHPHRPKTPTAQGDTVQRSKTPMPTSQSYAGGDLRASGRYTPNPGLYGRGGVGDYAQTSGRGGERGGWPDFSSPPVARRFDSYENPSHNRSYGGELSRTVPPAFGHGSPRGPAQPLRQSTSFETELPTPGDVTRLPRRTPFPPAGTGGVGTSPRSPSRGAGGDPQGLENGGSGGGLLEFTVTLHRQESGYGFRIIGGTEEGSQVSVGHIVPGGAADISGRLRKNDEIIHVDGQSVISSSHHRVVQLMTNAALNGHVTLGVRRRFSPFPDVTVNSLGTAYPYDVTVTRRETEGFGFVIISSVTKSGSTLGEFIGRIIENSPAERCGQLHIGDRIMAVNKVDISHMQHEDIVNLIKESGYTVTLTIGPPLDDASSTTSTSQRSSQGSMVNAMALPAGSDSEGQRRPDLSPHLSGWDRGPNNTFGNSRPRNTNHSGPEEGEIYSVELHRGTRGFGFSIRGGREFNNMPLFVLRMADDGAADLDGRLQVGDQILQINKISTESMTHTEAIEIIQSGGATVQLLMKRTDVGQTSSPSGRYPAAISNGPIGHSSPQLGRRQLDRDDYFSTYQSRPFHNY